MSNTPKVTSRKRLYLRTIHRLMEDKGWAPSYSEIGDVLGVHSSAVGMMVAKLEEEGWLERCPGEARTLQLTLAGKRLAQGLHPVVQIPVMDLPFRPDTRDKRGQA